MNELPIIKIGFLNRFYLTYDNIESYPWENHLIIELTDGNDCCKIKFKNVGALMIKSLNSMHKLVIASHDVRSYQLENTNYQIVENEKGSFSFYCESFEII